MMEYLIYFGIYVAVGIVLFVTLFWSYVFVMGAKRVRDRKTLTPLAYALSLPILGFGIVVDVLLNQFYMSVVCLDFTHIGTVTSRMKGYKYEEATEWQKKVSAWIESHIDDFDAVEGGHI